MTNDERNPNGRITKGLECVHSHSNSGIPSGVIRHSSLPSHLIAADAQLPELLEKIDAAERVAVDTEADSLHSYREKLCLLQISVPAGVGDVGNSNAVRDYLVDPLADIDLAPLRGALEARETVLHSADYDRRMLRRGVNFVAQTIFDTVIAARRLGIREFSLAACANR